MNKILIKRLRDQAKIPTKAYHSAGYDLYPAMAGVIKAGEQVMIPLGFATEFPSGYAAIIDDRSGTGNKGISHMAGVIDSDYRGEWGVILRNFATTDFVYGPEKAVAQVLFVQVEAPNWEWSESLADSFRGEKGFGSSDTQNINKQIDQAPSIKPVTWSDVEKAIYLKQKELLALTEDNKKKLETAIKIESESIALGIIE